MKRFRSITTPLAAITGLLVITLVSVFAVWAHETFDRQRAAAHVLSVVGITRDLFFFNEDLHVEQGVIAPALVSPDAANRQTIDQIVALQDKTRAALGPLSRDLGNLPGGNRSGLAAILRSAAHCDALFVKVLAAIQQPLQNRPAGLGADWQRASADLRGATDTQSSLLSDSIASTDAFVYEMMKVNANAWSVRVGAGNDRRIIATAVAEGGPPSVTQLQQFAESTGTINSPWAIVQQDSGLPAIPPKLKENIQAAQQVYFTRFRALRGQIIKKLTDGSPLSTSTQEWISVSNPALKSITAISKTSLDLVEAHVADRVAIANRNLLIAAALLVLSTGLACFTMIYVVWWVIRPLKLITQNVKTATDHGRDHGIPFETRMDEIGQFARALRVFRQNAAEKHHLENELIRNQVAREAAETSNRIKSEFLANMSHELRTPLNAVIGFSDMIQKRICGPQYEKYDEYVSLINESGHHLLNLVSDILDLAKIEAGKFVLDSRLLDLKEVVEYSINLNKRRATDRRIALAADLPETPLMLVADPRACKQIVLNLLSNAVKFTGPGGRVCIAASVVDGRVRIIVRDNGIGIAASALSRIGKAFEQASNDPMLAREGTGLGLALVRALVGQHGGSLRIDSKEHQGTVVTVELPLSQDGQIEDAA